MPGRKLPGKLEQLERAGASLLHNSTAVAAGRGGRCPAPAGSHTPEGERGWQKLSTPRGLRATPETAAPACNTRARTRHADHGLPEPAAAVARAPGWVQGRGDRSGVSRDLATTARVPAPRAPPGGPAPAPPRHGLLAHVPGRRAAT